MIQSLKKLFVCSLGLGIAAGALASPAFAEISLGLLPRLPEEQMVKMFAPLAAYLEKETGEKVKLVIPRDFQSFKGAVARGEVDYGFANPLVYVQAKKAGGAVAPLAIASEPAGGTAFRGILISRKGSGIQNVSDLKGKKLVFVEPDSAAGYVAQMLMLKNAGLEKGRDYTVLPFAGKHSEVVKAVAEGRADAGGIRDGDLEIAATTAGVQAASIQTVGTSEPIPNWAFFATRRANANKSNKVLQALLRLKPGSQEATAILGSARLTGFVLTDDQEYEPMRKAGQAAGVL